MLLPKEVLPLLPVTVTTAGHGLSLWLHPGHPCSGSMTFYRTQQELHAWLTGSETDKQYDLQDRDFGDQVTQTPFTHTFIFLDTLNPIATKGLALWLKRIKANGGQLGRLIILRRVTGASRLRKTKEPTVRRRLRKLLSSLLPDPEQSLFKALSPAQDADNAQYYQYIAERVADGSIKRFIPGTQAIPHQAAQKAWCSLNKQFVDHAISFAVRGHEDTPTPLHKLMSSIPVQQLNDGLEPQQVLVSKKDKLIVFLAANPPLIAKIALSDRSQADAQQSAAVLTSLQQQTTLHIPRVLQESFADGYFYSIETECTGQPLKLLKDARLEQKVVLDVFSAFIKLTSDTSSQSAGPLVEALLEKSYHQLEALLSAKQLNVIKNYFQLNHSEAVTPCGVVHHDLSQSNVLFNETDQSIAIIDWDESTLNAPLPLNLISYLFSRCSRQANNQRDAFAMVLNAVSEDSELHAFISKAYQILQSPAALHPLWTRLHWLLSLAHQVQFEGFTERAHLSVDAGKIVDEFFNLVPDQTEQQK